MDVMIREASTYAARRADAGNDELVERLGRAIRQNGTIEPFEWLRLRRASSPTVVGYGVAETAFCVIAQGRKEVVLGDRRLQYDPAHFLIAAAELPIFSQITEATPEQPYLGIVLKLDPTLVGSVMLEAGRTAPGSRSTMQAIDVSLLDAGLLDAVVRLIRLLDSPDDAPFLAPLVRREIVYRLLRGEQGERLCHIASHGAHIRRIASAIDRLRRDFDQPLRIDDLAGELGMSVSSFHHHFKEVTAMSPLQFQKRLRLQEARRLMLDEQFDAASAGYQVGYEDASHFNREYKRLFGEPPMRDVERLRGAADISTGL